jgi:hypothetical protein
VANQPIVANVTAVAGTTREALAILGAFLTRWANDPATSPNFADYPEIAFLTAGAIDVGVDPAIEGVRFNP